ncbi:hypothetical protein GCM10020255_011120 [Rhodococcus baikonurensis]
MKGDDRLLALADLAQEQWGMFTSAQAAESGVSAQHLKRLADRFILTRIRHGVYRLTGTPIHPADHVRAQWLALDPAPSATKRINSADPRGVASHRTAADLRELGDIDADIAEFTVPRRRNTRSGGVRFHVAALDPTDWSLLDGLPVTTPARTIVDLASCRTDGGHLAGVVWDALRTDQVSRGQLESELRPFAHLYGAPLGDGAGLIAAIIDDVAASDLMPTPADTSLARRKLLARLGTVPVS